MSELRYFSHSRVESDEICRRKRYLSREFGGTGLVPITSGWDLVFGNIQHQYLDKLAKEGKIDFNAARTQIYDEAIKVYDSIKSRDWAAISEGQLRGFVQSIWPIWMKEYDVYDSERWIEYEAEPGYVFRARQDLLLKSKYDGHLSYREYKTTSSNSVDWIASWAKSVQLHTSMFVLREAQGIQVRDSVVQGLYKGYKDKKNNLQRSPFSQGWCNKQYSMIPDYKYEYTRAKGWEGFSTYEEFPSLDGWVAEMPHEILTLQYPSTGPIYPRDDIAKKFFRQQLIREHEVAEAAVLLQKAVTVESIEAILDKYYRQNFSKCEPAWGYKCEFTPICWIPWIEEDPLGSGQFMRYVEPDRGLDSE